MNPLFSTLFGNAGRNATQLGDGQRATRATLPGSEGNAPFSQLLRDCERPAMPAPAPNAVPTPPSAPPPPASPGPDQTAERAAPARPPQGADGKTETQRQEARLAARRDSAKAEQPANKPHGADKPADEPVEAAARSDMKDVVADAGRDEGDDDKTPADAAGPPFTPTAGVNGPLALALLQGKARPVEGDVADITAADTAVPRPGARLRGADRGDAALPQTHDADGTVEVALTAGDFAAELAEAAAPPRSVKADGPTPAFGSAVDGLPGNAAAIAAPGRDATSATASPAPQHLSLAQGLYEPGFAPELAARLSVLAGEGVQEAQLHLNPAEMGPVNVQIVVDGQQAQVSFHAAQAETRAVLEQSLPDLAAALRDAGLTLSGGGVFQQDRDGGASADRRHGSGGSAQRGARDAENAPAGPVRSAVAARVSRGVVDLYA
jgi:hypothetical protein